uniref:Uncharacterized protein n=1 Tax=Ixodes ricinus TaxID=34613 RepID=A0A6B0UDK5_IXORI
MSSLHVAAPLLAHLFAAARRCRHVTTLPTPELLLSVHVTLTFWLALRLSSSPKLLHHHALVLRSLRGQPGRERAADLAARLRVVFVVVGRAQG